MYKRFIAALVAGVAALSLSACGSMSSSPEGAKQDEVKIVNTDPRSGPVFVRSIDSNGYYMATVKFCDGSTLVYNFIGSQKGGGSAIPDSDECK